MKREAKAHNMWKQQINMPIPTYTTKDSTQLTQKAKEALAGCSSGVIFKESREQAPAFCLGNSQPPCLISAIDLNRL